MNIHQALIRSRLQTGGGGLMIVSGGTYYFISLLMALYRSAQAMNDTPLVQLGAMIQSAVAALYQLTAPYLGFVWHSVPTLNQADLLTYDNLLFLGFLGVIIVGKQLMLAGRRLRERIRQILKHTEDLRWQQSVMRGSGGVSINADSVAQVNIYQQTMPPNPGGEWWTRPWGILGLSIIGGYLVAVLAKLTGMV
ncbi:YniB family protein [Pseudomonas sp. MN1F]|uniref:YniB family protein n=1 Tax=Pseudomonas sp. MN1F TaxID=1366632 RepID=UPI00128F01FC|nr:YniB family protein [Pseudomonas sp. MN1F]MQG91110.1 hypothetical protein [Pseudomonas sp. MN1F]